MVCKNCSFPIRTDHSFCSNCGAKVIRNRLSFKNLWFDISERYFNLDNTFIKTFWHLFTKPEVVIGDYIDGVRKKYLNPISYFGIALTLSGILVFFIKNFFIDSIDFEENFGGTNQDFVTKWKDISFDYSSLFFVSYLPLIAISSFLVFNKRNFNFTEHVILGIYILAHYSIVSFAISLGCLLISPESYLAFSQVFTLILLAYFIYVFQRCNSYKPGKLVLKTLLFSTVLIVLFFLLIILVMILLFVTGVLQPSDFASPK